MDMISKLPPELIETILCFLPIKEAARTSILSREWRYRWTKIPKLTFIDHMFHASTDVARRWGSEASLSETAMMTERFFYAIYQVLLIHEAPIHEFTLSIATDDTCFEIDHIIFYLSRKRSVKKLTLDLSWYPPPSSLFSLHQLTYLYLCGCELDRLPSFIAFGSLTSLFLQELEINEKALLHLLSHCPLLKILEMDYEPSGKSDKLTIIDLFECLPVIQNLSIWFEHIECFAVNGFPHELPTALVHLKYLWIQDIHYTYKNRSPIIALLLRSSPNLEKLWLNFSEDPSYEESERSDAFTLDDYSDIWLEHLNEFQIIYRDYKKSEFEFVKLILTKSPVLKKVKIFFERDVSEEEVREISVILFISPHASPAVDIIVEVLENSYPIFSRNLII